jgi:hypothetical protein
VHAALRAAPITFASREIHSSTSGRSGINRPQNPAMGQQEIAMAQAAMLDGKMGACAMHLSKAMHVGMMK